VGRRDPDAFTLGNNAKPYVFSLPVPADPVLSHMLKRQLEARLGEEGVCEGLNATADSFYSSQVLCESKGSMAGQWGAG
jgi:hypothetical protein